MLIIYGQIEKMSSCLTQLDDRDVVVHFWRLVIRMYKGSPEFKFLGEGCVLVKNCCLDFVVSKWFFQWDFIIFRKAAKDHQPILYRFVSGLLDHCFSC